MTTEITSADIETLAHVRRLRDLALKLIRESGRWVRMDSRPLMVVMNHGGVAITYLTPFQRPRNSGEIPGYALAVRSEKDVVLAMCWERTGALYVQTYEPGAWEAKLEEPAITANLAA